MALDLVRASRSEPGPPARSFLLDRASPSGCEAAPEKPARPEAAGGCRIAFRRRGYRRVLQPLVNDEEGARAICSVSRRDPEKARRVVPLSNLSIGETNSPPHPLQPTAH